MHDHQKEFVKAIIDNEVERVRILTHPMMNLDSLEVYKGMPMLHYLVKQEQAEILRIFLRNGAHLEVLDQDQISVTQRIHDSQNRPLMNVMEEHLAFVAKVDQDLEGAIAANDFSGLEASAQQAREQMQRKSDVRSHVSPYNPHELTEQFTADIDYDTFCLEYVKLENPFIYCNQRRETLIHLAVKHQRDDVLMLLSEHIDFKLFANARDISGKTALHIAVIKDNLSAYHALVLATPNSYLVRCHSGMTIMHYAAQYGHLACLNEMMFGITEPLMGQLLDVIDASGKLAVHYAASQLRSPECLEVLLSMETVALAIDLQRNTPLHYAAIYGFSENVALCLDAKMSPYQSNSVGKNAIELAVELGHHDIAEALVKSASPTIGRVGYHNINEENAGKKFYLIDQYLSKNQSEQARPLLSELVRSSDNWVELLARLKRGENILFEAEQDYLCKIYPKTKFDKSDLLQEASALKLLDEAVQNRQPLLQVVYLKSLGDLCISKQSLVKACHFYNSALVLYRSTMPKLRLGGAEYNSYDEQYLERCLSNVVTWQYDQFHVVGKYDFKRIHGYVKKLNEARRQCLFSDVAQARDNHSIMTLCYRKILADMIKHNSRLLKLEDRHFSVVVCGSIARHETSLYSDVEYLILTADDVASKNVHFERLAQLVELDIINVGESAFRIFNRGENSITQAGFSLDPHGIAPRGRVDINSGKTIGGFKLIGSPKILSRLINRNMFLNERELVVSLCTTAHLFGNAVLSEDFKGAVDRQLDGRDSVFSAVSQFFTQEVTMRHIIGQQCLLALTDEFKPRLDHVKNQEKFFMIKQELYRIVERFISSLALLTHCPYGSAWDRLAFFYQRGILTDQAVKNLTNTYNLTMLMRLRVQNHYHSEFDGAWHLRSTKQEYVLPYGMSDHDVYLISKADVRIIQDIFSTLMPISEAITQLVANQFDLTCLAENPFKAYFNQVQGSYFSKLYDYEKANEYFEKSIALNPNDVVTFASYIKSLAFRGNYEKAVQVGLEAMSRWETQSRVNDLNYALFLHNLSHILPYTGHMAQAKEVMLKAYEVVNRLIPNSQFTHSILLGLCDLIDNQDEHQRLLDLCVKIEKRVSIDPNMISQRIRSQAGFFINQRQFEQALVLINQALDVLKQSSIDSRVLLVELFSIKATLLWEVGHPEQAYKLYEQTLNMAKKIHGEWHDQTEHCYSDLGVCLLRMQKHDQAYHLFERALEINLKISPKINSRLGVRYNCLARVNENLGNRKRAIELELKAVEADKAWFGVNSMQTVIRLGDLEAVALEHDMDVWDRANNEAFEILERIQPERIPRQLQACVQVMQGIKDFKRAIKFLLLLLPYATEAEEKAVVYNNLGAMYMLLGDFENVMLYQQLAMSMQLNTPIGLSNKAISLRKQGEYHKAIETHLQSIQHEVEENGQDTIMLGKYYSYTAQTFYEAGNLASSEKYYSLAIDVFRKHYDDDQHPLIEDCIYAIKLINLTQTMKTDSSDGGQVMASFFRALSSGQFSGADLTEYASRETDEHEHDASAGEDREDCVLM